MRSLLLVLVVSAAFPAGAMPVTLYVEAQFDSQSVTGWRPFQVDSITGTFTPFDTSLGTLQSVRLRFGGSGGAEIVLRDLLPGDYRYWLLAEHSFFGPGGVLLDTTEQVIAGGSNTILDDGSVLYAPEHFSTGVPFEARFVDGNILGSPLQDITSNLGDLSRSGPNRPGLRDGRNLLHLYARPRAPPLAVGRNRNRPDERDDET